MGPGVPVGRRRPGGRARLRQRAAGEPAGPGAPGRDRARRAGDRRGWPARAGGAPTQRPGRVRLLHRAGRGQPGGPDVLRRRPARVATGRARRHPGRLHPQRRPDARSARTGSSRSAPARPATGRCRRTGTASAARSCGSPPAARRRPATRSAARRSGRTGTATCRVWRSTPPGSCGRRVRPEHLGRGEPDRAGRATTAGRRSRAWATGRATSTRRCVWRTDEASPSGLAILDDVVCVAGLRGERLWQVPIRDGRAGEPKAWFRGDYGRLRTVAATPHGRLWLTTSNTDGRGDAGAATTTGSWRSTSGDGSAEPRPAPARARARRRPGRASPSSPRRSARRPRRPCRRGSCPRRPGWPRSPGRPPRRARRRRRRPRDRGAATTCSGSPSPASTPSSTCRASVSFDRAGVDERLQPRRPAPGSPAGRPGRHRPRSPAGPARRTTTCGRRPGVAPAATVASTSSTAPALTRSRISRSVKPQSACSRRRRCGRRLRQRAPQLLDPGRGRARSAPGPARGSSGSPRRLTSRRPDVVTPVSSCQCRVSCTTRPPAASTAACRPISYRTARSTLRSELTFFVSVRVPSGASPAVGRSDTFASQRSEPCSIRTSETPSARSRSRRVDTYARATSGARSPVPAIGLVTISISGMPARL